LYILLFLKNISLLQFKNYADAGFSFNDRIIGLCGNNGIGKTNLLDAIYYLCFTKSYFSKSDQQNVFHGSSGFRIEGNFSLEKMENKVTCILRETGKKEFLLNLEPYEKFSAHVGKFPCVIIAPDDVQIIAGGSEERRRFLDALLCQLDTKYLQSLIEYNKILQQRNGYLRTLAERKGEDASLLDVYDEQLLSPGNYVFEQRQTFLRDILPRVSQFYKKIAGNEEPLELRYGSQLLQSSLENILSRNRDRDLLVQRTSGGIHKDDIDITLREQNFKNIGSQGQRKSLLFAMKLTEYETLKKAKGFAPLLLLDDVFEKLDAWRMHNLLDWVCIQNEGQIFITDTHEDRISTHLEQLFINYQLIRL
jgi:DNA replication and repair protein RecF